MTTEKKEDQNFQLFPYKKGVNFNWEKLQFDKEIQVYDLSFNLWDNNFDLPKNIHIKEDLKIGFGEKSVNFILKIDNINGTIERGAIEKMRYFRPTSLVQTGLIYDMFSVIEDKVWKKLNINFLDIIDRAGLIRIDCKQRLPLNRVVYFRNLTVIFDRIEMLTYRGNTKYCIVTNIISVDLLLQK